MKAWLFPPSVVLFLIHKTDANNCLHYNRINNLCECCNTGYTGYNCSQSCIHCESRLFVGKCETKCKDGYFGALCQYNCSDKCDTDSSGTLTCNRETGNCDNKCIPGYYGEHCSNGCSRKCYQRECEQFGGTCFRCSNKSYSGNRCDQLCNKGCYNGTCHINGTCTDGCKGGYYGEQCFHECGENCVYGKCVHDIHLQFHCTEGCVDGYRGASCSLECPVHCQFCDQHNGSCYQCGDGYKECDNNACVLNTTSCDSISGPVSPAKANVGPIIIGIAVPVIILLVIGVVLFVLIRRRVICYNERDDQSELERLLDNKPQMPGTLGTEQLQRWVEEVKASFVSTKSCDSVCRLLKHHKHATICGAIGEGKTTMALFIAEGYSLKGYQVVYVSNVDKFELEICTRLYDKIFLILDDIFGSHGLSTTLEQLLNSISLQIQQCKKLNQDNPKELKTDIVVVFTSRSYNFKDNLSKLQCEGISLFARTTVADLTTDFPYSKAERKSIFETFKRRYQTDSAPSIFNEEPLKKALPFGFPRICDILFTDSSANVCENLISHLKSEFVRLVNLQNEQTAALVLMFLCEDDLDLSKLEMAGQDKIMDVRFESLTKIIPSATRLGTARAVRSFKGTFFTGTDRLKFSHPLVYNACALAVYEINSTIVLNYASIPFLLERLKNGTGQATTTEILHFIQISDNYYDILAARTVFALRQGRFSKSVTHPIVEKEFSKSILRKLKKAAKSDEQTTRWIHMKDNGKGLLYWLVQGGCVSLIEGIESCVMSRFNETEIHEAVKGCIEKDNLELLKELFARLSETSQNDAKNSLLLMCARTKSRQTAEFLLDNGADINHRDRSGQTYLHLLCRAGEIDMLSDVKLKRSDIFNDTANSAVNSLDNDGRTPLMLAVLSGSWECFQLLKDFTKHDIADKYGDHVIHLACQGGNSSIVKDVVTSSNINSPGRQKRTPIMKAARYAKLDVFDLLMSNNADVNRLDRDGDSLLHLACDGGNVAIVKKLANSSNINLRGGSGWTPVMAAARSGQQHAFEYLMACRADLTLMDKRGDSLLHLACRGGCTAIVEKLVTPSNINNKGSHGWTPIMNAAMESKEEVFNYLLSSNADLSILAEDGDNVIHIACRGDNLAIVEKLVTYSNVNTRGEHGWTPIMNAAESGRLAIFDYLVSLEADQELKDDYDDGLLHLACRGGNANIVRKLVTESNINSKGNLGFTPLMNAVREGHKGAFDVLMLFNADLSVVDEDGDTALHWACVGGNTPIVQKLVTKLDINIRGRNGMTPLMIAAENGQKEVFDFLLSNGADSTLENDDQEGVVDCARRGGNIAIIESLEPEEET